MHDVQLMAGQAGGLALLFTSAQSIGNVSADVCTLETLDGRTRVDLAGAPVAILPSQQNLLVQAPRVSAAVEASWRVQCSSGLFSDVFGALASTFGPVTRTVQPSRE